MRHRGRPRNASIPWLSKNSARKRAGKLHIWRGSADQTADAWGTISRSMKAREKRWRSSQSRATGLAVRPRRQQLARGAVEARQVGEHPVKARGHEMARLANRPLGEALVYSKSPLPSLTLKLIVDGCEATPRALSSRSKLG